MLLLDEAYGETAPAGTLPAIDIDRPNVIRFRTFSKTYGLAGLRVGYAIGEAEDDRAPSTASATISASTGWARSRRSRRSPTRRGCSR